MWLLQKLNKSKIGNSFYKNTDSHLQNNIDKQRRQNIRNDRPKSIDLCFVYTYSLCLMFLLYFVSFQQPLFSRLNQVYKNIYLLRSLYVTNSVWLNTYMYMI